MFNEESLKRAAAVLQNHGATHFMLMPDGQLLAVSGVHNLAIEDAPDVQMGTSPSEDARAEADAAVLAAQESAAAEAAAHAEANAKMSESLLDKAKRVIGL